MTTIPTDSEKADGPSYAEALARLEAIIDECKRDPEKIKFYFGYAVTSAGDM